MVTSFVSFFVMDTSFITDEHYKRTDKLEMQMKYDVFAIYIKFATVSLFLDSVLKIHKNGTEVDVKQAFAALLKAAPDRTGGWWWSKR